MKEYSLNYQAIWVVRGLGVGLRAWGQGFLGLRDSGLGLSA